MTARFLGLILASGMTNRQIQKKRAACHESLNGKMPTTYPNDDSQKADSLHRRRWAKR